MIQDTVKRIKQDNVNVAVVCKGERFDVYIDIYSEVVVSTNVRNNYFGFKFKWLNENGKIDDHIHLEVKNRKYKKGCSTQHFSYVFKTKEYYFKISLAPHFYVSDLKLEDDKKRLKDKRKNKTRKKAKELARSLSTDNISKPGLKTPSKTTYTKNNVSHPFQGGQCAPK